MKKIGSFVVKNKVLITIISLVLLIPALIGICATKVNYDLLAYLPSDIETVKGQKILTDDFNMGAFAIGIVENMKDKDLIELEDDIRDVNGVEKVLSINDLTGTAIPIEMLPNELLSKVSNKNTKLLLITFEESTSDEVTLNAIKSIRKVADSKIKLGGMSSMVVDMRGMFNEEMPLYIIIAVILCIIILELALDSYIVPIILMSNIGIAILYNMGSNIMFGEISYITRAIASVLQLGVTTDFSIFLYHKYQSSKRKYKNKEDAMEDAIYNTLTSVLGSSLTTIAGFLALCTMELTLGVDIGIVMAKGVLFGLICVITLFPSLLLILDKYIEKTKHKSFLPEFSGIKKFVMKHYRLIFTIFIVLLIPAFLAQRKTEVYYKLDESIPDNYAYSIAVKTLKEDYGMITQAMIIVRNELEDYKVNNMIDEIKNIDGVDMVASPSLLTKNGISNLVIPDDIKNIYESDKYKIVLINSSYDIATTDLNNQITEINKIVKKYDKKAIMAGEGPLMKDLITTTDRDFKSVNYTSIIVIFILMLLVLRSISLPVLLVTTIEFAIFLNMGIPYFTGTSIPFVASVVIGTIQLGATIDYAILMTTKYLEERKNGKEKNVAIQEALNNSVTSIFVSGMCFFAATVGVGIISKIDMIGSLCTLIARGAIISMFVVVLVVPTLLKIFDTLICKTTLGFKKGEINNENN